MRGYGSFALCCLGWQSSAPVQGSPSHHWMWAACGTWCPQALLASSCWIWSGSQLGPAYQGEKKSQRPLCSSWEPYSGGQ